ncbi:CsgG/HfaB family protein [Escherichia coli]
MKATSNLPGLGQDILASVPTRNTSSDQIAVNLRVVNVSTGEILSSVNAS